MEYKITVAADIEIVSSQSHYGYNILTDIYLDGVKKVTAKAVKENSPSTWNGYDESYTTNWITVSNKTSGTTALKVRVYSTTSDNPRDMTFSYSLPVAPAASVITAVGNFNIEDTCSATITKYSTSFKDTLTISCGTTIVKTISDYQSGTAISFTVAEILNIYNLISNNSTSATFSFTLNTYDGSTHVGYSSKSAVGTISGTLNYKASGSWDRTAVPWYRESGVWRRGVAFTKQTDWKRGK